MSSHKTQNFSPVENPLATLYDVVIEPIRLMSAESSQWDYEIQIALPPSYHSSDKNYPVLWVTDGSFLFQQAVRTVNFDLKKHLPECIVVAVGDPPGVKLEEHQYRRAYDFGPFEQWDFTAGFGRSLLKEQTEISGLPHGLWQGGGGAEFLSFLVDQLRPVLSRDYRMTDDHTLFGDSGGGVFCAYALFSRPGAFKRYICGSPCLYSGDHALFRMEEHYAQTHDDLNAQIFFGAGEGEVLEGDLISALGVVSSMTRMAEILCLRGYPSLDLYVNVFPCEEHASVISSNLSRGLRTLWKNTTHPT